MTMYRVHTLDTPLRRFSSGGYDNWGVFVAVRGADGLFRERRVFGPANVYDCQRELARLLAEERHSERTPLRLVPSAT